MRFMLPLLWAAGGELFVYDPELRKQNRLSDVMILLAFSYLGVVYSGVGR